MILRLSQKLSSKIKAGTLSAHPPDENAYADWSAHLFTADRVQYILICTTKSLYSVVMYGKGITDENQFIRSAITGIRESLAADGHLSTYDRFIAPATWTIKFAKALNRSVTGSINDFVLHAGICLTESELSPFDTGFKLNEIPCAPLVDINGRSFARPKEAFKALPPPPGL